MLAAHRSIKASLDDAPHGETNLARSKRQWIWKHRNGDEFTAARLQPWTLAVFLVLSVDPESQQFNTRSLKIREDQNSNHRKCILDARQAPYFELKSRSKTHPLAFRQSLDLTKSVSENANKTCQQIIQGKIELIEKSINSILERGELR